VLAVSQGILQDVKMRKLRVHPRPPPSGGRRARGRRAAARYPGCRQQRCHEPD
jgi:hypothetical protein